VQSELTDKEFRYLRTVIVTGRRLPGFNQELAPPSFNLPARAGVTPYTSTHRCVAECCVFYNSRSHDFLQPLRPSSVRRQPTRAHLLPKLRCQFAEFLLLSSLKRLEFSSCPRVSDYGTVPCKLKLEAFLGAWYQQLPALASFVPCLEVDPPDLPKGSLYTLHRTSNTRPA